MAQQKNTKKWEPPPFLLKKSQQQLDEEAEKNKPIDMSPGKWQPPPGLGIMIGGKPVEEQKPINEALVIEPTEAPRSALEKLYEAGSRGALDYLPEWMQKYRPKEFYKKATQKSREYGESIKSDDSLFEKAKKKGYGIEQAIGENFASGLEEALNPINLGLLALSGGSSALFNTAKATKDVQTAQKLYQIGKALEIPGKAASVGMVAHGGHKVFTGETTEEQVGGGIEALMGAAGFRFRGKREYPKAEPKNITPEKMKVNTGVEHGPNPQKFFPVRGNENPIKPGKFTSGEKGTYKEGDLVYSDLGGNRIPAEVAYKFGTIKATKSGSPYVQPGTGGTEPPVKPAVNTTKLEQIRQYMNAVQNKEIPEGTKFEDYVNSLQKIEPEVITTPSVQPEIIKNRTTEESIAELDRVRASHGYDSLEYQQVLDEMQATVRSNEAQLPDVRQPSKGLAQYRFFQPGAEASPGYDAMPGFHMYDIPTETGMSTVSGEEAISRGYELPPISEAMSRPPNIPIEPEIVSSKTGLDRLGRPIEEGYESEITQVTPDGEIITSGSYEPETKLVGSGSTTELPDLRQLANPVESIGDEIINPTTDDLSTGIELNEPTTPIRASDQWQEILDELDARNAPDSEYRDILSTGGKDPLKKRETWRGRVQKYIQMDRDRDNEPSFSRVKSESESPSKRSVRDILGLSDKMDRREFFRRVSKSPDQARQDLAKMFGPKFQQQINAEVDRLYPGPATFDEFDTNKFVKAVEQAWETVANSNPEMRALKDVIDRGYTGQHAGKLWKISDNELGFSDSGTGIIGRIAEELKSRLDNDEPSFARVKGGGLTASVNIGRAVTNITKDYTSPLSGIMDREAAQNALDAADALGSRGVVKIRLNSSNKTIEMYDNGGGLNEDQLSNKLVEIFATGKEGDAGATGGKGIGSASYIYGGKHFEIETISVDPKDGLKYRIIAGGTPEQFLDPDRGSDWDKTLVNKLEPTGTTVKIKLKSDQDISDARNMTNSILDYSRNRMSKIILDIDGMTNEPLKDVQPDDVNIFERNFSQSSDDKLIGDFVTTNRNSKIEILIPSFDENVPKNYFDIKYLNNGMYQFSERIHLGEMAEGVPDNVLVDIHPLVDDQSDLYPFINTREDIKKDIRKEISDFINKNISKPGISKRKNRVQELYDSMLQIPVRNTKRKSIIYDPGDRLTLTEKEYLTKNPVIQQLIQTYDNIIDDIVQLTGRQKWIDRLEGVGLVFDPNMNGVHIPNPTTGKSTILINPFTRIGSTGLTPGDSAWKNVITSIHEVAHIGTEHGKAIKLNPDDLSDPRLGKFLESYMNQLVEHGDISIFSSTGHGMDFAHRLGEAYAKFGVERTFEAANKIHSIFTDQSRGYSSEIQKLLQIYIDSRGRPALTEDLLSGTGLKQPNRRSDGKGDIPSNNNPDGDRITPNSVTGDVKGHPTQVIEAAVAQLKEALIAGKLARDTQDLVVSSERGRRAGMMAGVKTRGLAGYRQRLGMLAGPLPKAEMDTILTDENVDILFDVITDSEQLRQYQEISAGRGLMKLLAGDAPQNSEMALLTQVFGDPKLGGLIELHAGMGLTQGPTRALVSDIMNASKKFKASMDLSGSLRQALPFIHRKEYWKAFWNMHKYLGSEKSYQAGMEAIMSHPDYHLIRETPLFLAEIGADIEMREELFLSRFGDHIPGIKQSQRAYVGLLNEIRFNVMASFLADMRRLEIPVSQEIVKHKGTKREQIQTISTPELDEVAKFVNIFTGRGSLGVFEKMAKEANYVLWSPRNVSSRLTMLNPFYYKNASPFVRKQAAKSLLAMAGAGLAMLALAKLNGAEVEYDDPTSADFMKARFGRTRMDPWAGTQQNTVAGARILTYLHNASLFLRGKPIARGAKYRPGSGYNTRTARDVSIDFAENKLSPLGNFVSSMADLGKSYEPSGASKLLTDDWNLMPNNRVTKEVINMFSPMMIDTLIDLMKDDPKLFPLGPETFTGKTLPLGVASIYGSSVQTYDERIPGGQYKPRVPRLLP